jgi:hypothetical protein
VATSYITAGMLTSHPAGLSWNVVPTLTASSAEQEAQLAQVCWIATSEVDSYCRQPLRATLNTDTGCGPGHPRVAVDRATGKGTLITRRWPVTSVEAVQVSPAGAWPSQWAAAAPAQYRVRNPVLQADGIPVTGPSGGNVIETAPGVISWDLGRGGWDVLESYVSGWPHTSLTQDAAQDDTEVHVDDVTGWAGVTGFAYDGMLTEMVTVTAVSADSPRDLPGAGGAAQAGPGTLTLSSPLAFGHATGTVVSALPGNAIHAAALKASVQALETIDAIATQSLSGQMAGGTQALAEEAELLLDNFRRVI